MYPLQYPLDVPKYMGLWYEIAKIPQNFEPRREKATANYALNIMGTINVLNTYYDNSWNKIGENMGISEIIDPLYPGALRITFPPTYIDHHPNYLIHATNYEYSIVGTINRQGLYILYKRMQMPAPLYQEIINYVQSIGYDINRIQINYNSII